MRKLALLLVLALAVSLSACGKTTTDTPAPTTPTTTTTTATPTPTRTDTFAVGTVTNNSYENAFFGIGCTFSNGWTIDNVGACNSFLTQAGGDITAAASDAKCFHDMIAYCESGTISVYVENLSSMWDHLPSIDEYVEMQQLMCEENPDIITEAITGTVGNLSCKGLKITVNEYQTDVFYYIPSGKYMVTVGFSGANAEFAAQYLPIFYTF